jgi:carboxyl-terminal processing protease
MTSRTRLIVLLVSAPIIAFAVIGGFLGNAMAREETYRPLAVFQDVVRLVTSNYVEPVNSDRIMTGAMRGLAESLDPDSAYLNPQQVEALQRGEHLPSGDVGITLTRQYYLRVIAARDGSPAAKAGLRPNDFVRMIDDKPTREMSVLEGVRLLRGAPGSKVKLTIIRTNPADPRVIELTREPIVEPAVSARMQASGVGYLRLPAFTAKTAEQVREKVASLQKEGAHRLLVDVRDCADGDLTDGLAVARLFVPSGTLAIRETRNQPRESIAASAGDGAISVPVVVLVNAGTAGPAELFAAALAGNKRADLVGERTVGRVTTQKLVPLLDGSAMLLSNAWFLTPAGEQIEEKGLTPGVEVEEPDVDVGAPPPATDPILLKAIERLEGKTSDTK